MAQEQKHQMHLKETYPSGIEEWHCPQCHYRMALQWEPYKKLVLAEGDKFALHSALKGDFQLNSPDIQPQSEQEDLYEMSEELRDALNEFLNDVDFGD